MRPCPAYQNVMIVLAESVEQLEPSASVRDIAASTEAARLAGATVFTIPADFAVCETADAALAHIAPLAMPTATFWVGYIPDPARYEAIYAAARARNLRLPNTLAQHLDAQEFPRTYPRIADLTARTAFVASPDAAALGAAVQAVGGFPVFVKGAVQSRKGRGWRACVAESAADLAVLTSSLLSLPNRSRGVVAVRELLPLCVCGHAPNGFPLGREFRVFVYRGVVAGAGYYWETAEGNADRLTEGERSAVHALALEAARRIRTGYIAVDIGQLTDGTWRVIETGDGQFSGLSRVAKIALWNALHERS